jgi:hypothetical protein
LTLWRSLTSLLGWRRSFLTFNRFFRLLLFWLFVFWRNRIKNSCWLHLFLILCKSCDVDCFTFVFFQSPCRIFDFIVLSSPMPSIRLGYSLNIIEWNV